MNRISVGTEGSVPPAAQRFFLRAVLPAVILLGLGAGACKDTEPKPPGDSGQAAEQVPSDFTVVLGQGGGFTGRWEGYTIRRDGSVLAWSGPKAEDNPAPVGTLTPAQVEALWAQVQEAGFFSEASDERGNMTGMLRVTADGKAHSAFWVPSIEGVEPTKAPVETLYRYCRDLARSAATG